ncbi:MAG: HYR domain-containing protein, partial [Saprospiraceae bacterium]|nr:HYR domain-containing protein [Saprospiraceae bacterium]
MNSFSFNIQHRAGALRLCALLLCLFAGGHVYASAPPNWTVDPDDYEFNLNVSAQVYFDGVQSNASGSIVGAFIGNELRGVANATIIGNEAYFFLTVYSNVYNGETVHFKLYHAPGDAVYPALESVVFLHNASFGNVGAPFEINVDPDADFAPELLPLLADTTLQGIPFETVDLANYLVSLDGDPVTYLLLPGSNLNASEVNGILTVSPVSGGWTGTDSVRIIARENTAAQLADTIWGLFTVLPDYGPPVWQNIPNQTIFPGGAFTNFDLDNFLTFGGDCHAFDLDFFPFSGTDPDPAWQVVPPGAQPMTIVARPLFVDEILVSPGSKLAGFVNGVLAGWAAPTGDHYNLQLANVGAGNITFRFYDAANQFLYEDSTSLGFNAGGSTGTVASPYLIQLSPLFPILSNDGVVSISVLDPTWLGVFPIDFIVWDCLYPDTRRDTTQATFTVTTDERPQITSSATVGFEENACYTLYDTETSDPSDTEGSGLVYALAGGSDVARFSINTVNGVLSWVVGFVPDFEVPADANGDNNYVVNVMVTNTAGFSDTLQVTVSVTNQVLEPFTVTINGGVPAVCVMGNTTLLASGGIAYLWNNGATTSSITVTSAGTYTVTATSTGACTATASINVAPPVVVTATGSTAPVCLGSTIQLSSTPSGGTAPYVTFVWSGPNGYTASTEDPAGFPAVLASAGVYAVTVTDAAGCTSSATTTIAVSGTMAPAITVSSNSPVCVGASIVLTSTPSGGSGVYTSFSWTGPAGYTASAQNPAGFPSTLAAAGTYVVVVTDNAGCTATGNTVVIVNNVPAIAAANNGPKCIGGTILLTSTPSGGSGVYTTFQWSGPNGYGSIVEDPAGFPASLANAGVYNVSVTDGNGCSASGATTVVVNGPPTVSAILLAPVCVGGNVALGSMPLGGSGVYTAYQWSGPNNFTSAVQNPPAFPAIPATAGVYSVTVTDASGCSASGAIEVNINPVPSITAANSGPVCQGASISLSSTPSGGSGGYALFNWTGPDNYVASQEDPASFSTTQASAGVYQVKVTDGAGCTATATTTVVVNTKPTLVASSNAPLCTGGLLSLQSTATGNLLNAVYNWIGPNNFTSGQEDPTPFTVTLINAGAYSVTITDLNGCSASAVTSVAVSSLPSPSITATSNSPVCGGTNLILTSTATGGSGVYANFAWSGPNNFTSAQEDPTPFVVYTNGAGTYNVTVTDSKNCKASTTVAVAVTGPPTNPTSNSPVCLGAPIQLNGGPDLGAGVTYQWTGPNNYTSAQRIPAPFAATATTAGVYTLIITQNGCSGLGTTTLVLSPNLPPVIVCPANTTLAANASCSALLGTYAPASVSDDCTANPTVTQSPAASTVLNGHNDVETVTLTANDGFGNTASCNFTVTLKDVTPPVITCPANTTVAADASCNGTLGVYTPASISDNCAANPTATQSPAASTVLSGHNDVETVTLTANDGNGNMASCTFTVTLKDVTPPVITCPANATVAADASCNGTVGTHQPLSVSDNCVANPAVTQSPASSTVLSGHNDVETVTLTANDGNGNSASCSLTVTLKDVTPPSVVCPANVTIAADASCSGVLGTYQAVSATDNCTANPAVSQSPASSTVLSGHNDVETVTLTADDGNGNTGVCTFIVMLKDVSPPVITCPANTTVA